MRIEFFIFRFQKLLGVEWGSIGGVDLVSFVEGESVYDFFNILALIE